MNVLVSLAAVVALFLLGMLGALPGLDRVFGVAIPYLALTLFILGLIHRVWGWASSAVPFRIPTTSGQQKSLSWIKPQSLDNPHSGLGVIGRMFLEVFFFRSLLRNTKAEMTSDRRLVYATDLGLWIGAMAMHWTFLIVLIRHLRLFMNPVPACVTMLEHVDSFFEFDRPALFVSSIIFVLALLYLLYRRLANPQVRYISLMSDYFPLFLLIGIGVTGVLMRHVFKTDIRDVKHFAVGLATFAPVFSKTISPLFYGHLFLVSVLLAYFPFSKLVHMAGVFLSPTRNMANNNRTVRHVNPWDYEVKVHSYEEYEDELRDKMKAAGVPVEKQ